MNRYFCKRLYEEINFDAEKIYVCAGMSLGPSFEIFKKDKNLKKYIKELLSWRKNVTRHAYFGKLPEQCVNCKELEVKKVSALENIKEYFLNPKNSFCLKNIIVKSYKQCEFSCVYCLEKKYTKGKKTTNVIKSEFYDFLPIFKELIKNNMIDRDNVRIEIQGGSISVWDEFEDVLNCALSYGIKNYFFHTNAHTYLPIVSDLAKNYSCGMSISIDSGSSETFKVIKGEDKFDTVVDNIIKYANSGIDCSIKYILIENINDNLTELKKFCEKINYIRSKISDVNKVVIMLDIDFRKSLSVKDYEIPENYLCLFDYVKGFCKENKIGFGTQNFIRKLLEKRNNQI